LFQFFLEALDLVLDGLQLVLPVIQPAAAAGRLKSSNRQQR
jgi:hypothetical protein